MFEKNYRLIPGLASMIVVLSILMVFPHNVFAGGKGGPDLNTVITDSASSRLIGYWDLRDRETFFQVTNTNGDDVRIHIQVFDVSSDCAEFDYFDTLTPRDTHVYDIRELDRNNGVELSAPDFSEGHGIIAVTHVNNDDSFNSQTVLTGNFRIQDSGGFEYRTNLAGPRSEYESEPGYINSRINFNDISGASFTDLVVIALEYINDPGSVIPVTQEYEVGLFDEDENPVSCSPVILGCSPDFPFSDVTLNHDEGGVINVGINQAITNSRGGPSLCLGNDTTGYLELRSGEFFNGIPEGGFVFIGLNNGDGTGSMDSAVSSGELIRRR